MRSALFWLIFITLGICGKPDNVPPRCAICLQVLKGEYSIDAWDNPFHSHHEKEGIFCHSCSRIISQEITHGGFRYTDGRHLCSLCQISIVEHDSTIHASYTSVIAQLRTIGIHNIPYNIPIEHINLIDLNEKFSYSAKLLKSSIGLFISLRLDDQKINQIVKVIQEAENSYYSQ